MSRRWLVAVLAIAVLGVGAAAALGTSKAPAPCRGGSGTLYDDHEVRVFTRELPDGRTRTVACSRLNGHRSRLAQDQSDTLLRYVAHISAPGRWLGFSRVTYDSGGSGAAACIVRIRDGKHHCTPNAGVLGLGATRAGSLAWLALDGYDPDGNGICCTVFKRDAGTNHVTKLDSGADIERDSFAVAGHRAYWTKAGQPQSAQLP